MISYQIDSNQLLKVPLHTGRNPHLLDQPYGESFIVLPDASECASTHE